ncbi:class I SAM-dependent methyltransferase [Sphingomonas sp. M1A8_2b]
MLIDFDDSIFGREAYVDRDETPPVKHGSAIGRLLDRLTYGGNPVAPRTIGAFLRLLDRRTRPRVLVIGGGTVGDGVSALYDEVAIDMVGTDVYATDYTIVICDGHSLPFRAASFDGVVIQAVLEHVLEPHRVVNEIHRVLKPNGIVLAETPFMQQVHMAAYDFTRFTFSGHRWLFRRFEQVAAGTALGPGVALLWSIQHMARSLGAGGRGAAIVTAPFFWLRMLDRFVQHAPARDAASGVYFLGRRSDTTLRPADMPEYYRAPCLNDIAIRRR